MPLPQSARRNAKLIGRVLYQSWKPIAAESEREIETKSTWNQSSNLNRRRLVPLANRADASPFRRARGGDRAAAAADASRRRQKPGRAGRSATAANARRLTGNTRALSRSNEPRATSPDQQKISPISRWRGFDERASERASRIKSESRRRRNSIQCRQMEQKSVRSVTFHSSLGFCQIEEEEQDRRRCCLRVLARSRGFFDFGGPQAHTLRYVTFAAFASFWHREWSVIRFLSGLAIPPLLNSTYKKIQNSYIHSQPYLRNNWTTWISFGWATSTPWGRAQASWKLELNNINSVVNSVWTNIIIIDSVSRLRLYIAWFSFFLI